MRQLPISILKPKEQFIGFIDILGFSALTKAAEDGNGLWFNELDTITKRWGTEGDRKRYEQVGPIWCPQSPLIRKDLAVLADSI